MNNLKNIFTLIIVFLTPLFFLPITQEYFITNKIYLLAFAGLLLLFIATIQFFVTRKIAWRRSPFDLALSFILIAVVLSIIIASPNKIDALLNPYFGFVGFSSLLILYFVLVQSATKRDAEDHLLVLQYSASLLALISIFFFFNPFKNATLPIQFQFLKFPTFSPLGNQLDFVVFLGFILVLSLSAILIRKKAVPKFTFVVFSVCVISIILALYQIFKPETAQQTLFLTPLRQSWFAAVETLKNPMSAIFGVGIGNLASIFSQVKDSFYNQSIYWQISSFNISRSALLHIFAETGLLGLTAFAFLFYSLWRELKKVDKNNSLKKSLSLAAVYVFLILVFFPPSFISFFLLVFLLFLVFAESHTDYDGEKAKQELNLASILPIYLILGIISMVLILGGGYLLGRSYLAEYSFKKSLEESVKNDALAVYKDQQQAVILNPYNERFHINFAQTNLLIANNIASKKDKLSDQEKQTVVQAIQAAINEAKSTVALNPQKANNWQTLATVYQGIANAVKGADAWAVSSYQRAIRLDPNNPIYRLNLGGVYYSLQKYNDASASFEQAVELKPDWANAHYNLAWASYQLKDYQQAVSEMQNVLKLVNQKQYPDDYKKAKAELEKFKSQLPTETETPAETQSSGNLQLPTSEQQPQISPKLELPQGASPEAK